MYDYIVGKVKEIGAGFIVIESKPWGIKVFVSAEDLLRIKIDEDIKLYLYHAKYEDKDDLYGFLTKRARDVFVSMLKVPGIGAKVAYSILSSLGEKRVLEAVEKKDPDLLARAKGVGKKKASMIILQLKGVIKNETLNNMPGIYEDAYKALVSMGYKDKEISDAFDSIRNQGVETENIAELIKMLLKELRI